MFVNTTVRTSYLTNLSFYILHSLLVLRTYTNTNKNIWITIGTSMGQGGCRAVTLPLHHNLKSTNLEAWWYQGLMWFMLQPKSATEIGWWLVHRNIENCNRKLWIYRIFQLVLVFSVTKLDARLEILTWFS